MSCRSLLMHKLEIPIASACMRIESTARHTHTHHVVHTFGLDLSIFLLELTSEHTCITLMHIVADRILQLRLMA